MAYYSREPDEEVADALLKLTFMDMCRVAEEITNELVVAGFEKIEIMELGSVLTTWAAGRMQQFRDRIEASETAGK